VNGLRLKLFSFSVRGELVEPQKILLQEALMFEICIKAFLIPTKLVYGNPLKLQMFLLIFIILSGVKGGGIFHKSPKLSP
jgi:hypothetical protein